MSMNNLSVDGEFRYIIQWFNEWSELQRDDFLPILIDYLNKDNTNGIYVNGIVAGLAEASCADKPMNLFQCRIKLFREWTQKWPEEFKEKLKTKVMEIDLKFAERLTEEIKNDANHVPTNGLPNGIVENGVVVIDPIEIEINEFVGINNGVVVAIGNGEEIPAAVAAVPAAIVEPTQG